VNGVDLFLDQALTLQAQQGQAGQRPAIIEAGVRGWLGDRVKLDVGMVGSDDLLRLGELEESVVVPDLEAGEVEGIIAEFDPFSAQVGGDGVAVPLKGDGGCLVDLALSTVEEGLA
jgi:hypothetical protein